MDNIKKLFNSAKQAYNKAQGHSAECRDLSFQAHQKLATCATYQDYGPYLGSPKIEYNVFSLGTSLSRPVRSDLFIIDSENFHKAYDEFMGFLSTTPRSWSEETASLATKIVYTSVMSFACSFDLWQRGSRKSPGTYFEVFMAALLQQMRPDAIFSKHIQLSSLLHDKEVSSTETEEACLDEPTEDEGGTSVSTDLVVGLPSQSGGLVIPLKITTRERIVQPFAHQRILDSAFGVGEYRSLLVCISETQLDESSRTVKQVCVPGTVKLFQKYLAPLYGLYYCDVPQRYAASDMQKILPVRTLGDFFQDVEELLNR